MNNQRILEYLSTIDGLGINRFTVSKLKVMGLSEHSYLWSERQIEKAVKNYIEETSPLYRIIQTLITEINEYGPVYPYHFNLKAEEDETISNNEIIKITGRQYNTLCFWSKEDRKYLFKRLRYDYEGYDISSTIWTTALALITGKADPEFDLKAELVKEEYKDVKGEVITNRKLFKPLTQICFFCINAHHAYETYKSPKVKDEFKKKAEIRGEEFVWPEFDEETFNKIYYKCKGFINMSNDFIDSIFFWESIWELLVIRQCYREGIRVLNVYDCFFLQDLMKYKRLKEIIKEQLEELIKIYKTTERKYNNGK